MTRGRGLGPYRDRSVRILCILGLLGYRFCAGWHYCMDGHLVHYEGPFFSPWFDVAWLACLVTAGVLSLRSMLPFRGLITLFTFLLACTASRTNPQTDGFAQCGSFFWLVIAFLVLWSLRRPALAGATTGMEESKGASSERSETQPTPE